MEVFSLQSNEILTIFNYQFRYRLFRIWPDTHQWTLKIISCIHKKFICWWNCLCYDLVNLEILLTVNFRTSIKVERFIRTMCEMILRQNKEQGQYR